MDKNKYSENNNNRKGIVISIKSLDNIQIDSIKKLEKKLGDVIEIRKYNTGIYGAFFQNNQFRFIRGNKNVHGGSLNNYVDYNMKKEVTDERWSKNFNNNYQRLDDNHYNIKSEKKRVSLKQAVDLLKKYYLNN